MSTGQTGLLSITLTVAHMIRRIWDQNTGNYSGSSNYSYLESYGPWQYLELDRGQLEAAESEGLGVFFLLGCLGDVVGRLCNGPQMELVMATSVASTYL